MPESVTDRPTKAHEYLFLLTKSARYFYDADAIREEAQDRPQPSPDAKVISPNATAWLNNAYAPGASGYGHNPAGRNKRSVWEVPTEPYPDAHFATYPQALIRPCIQAGSPEWVCATCGKPRERLLERKFYGNLRAEDNLDGSNDATVGISRNNFGGQKKNAEYVAPMTVGWSDCGHNNYRPGVVLDPFLGSGTTALVARRHNRHSIGIELNPAYAELAARRLAQQSLLTQTEGAA